MRLFLFDIDGTIASGSRRHHKAFSMAFNKIHGIEISTMKHKFHGYTDQMLIHEYLNDAGIINHKTKEVMRAMVEAYLSLEDDGLQIIPGVKIALDYLKDDLIGHVTGNLKEIAMEKMKTLKIADYFKVGGYGSDAKDRADLVRIAIKRAEMFRFKQNNNVYLIGDTAMDIDAAKRSSVIGIGVATGQASREDLKEAGADILLDNLSELPKYL